MHVPFNSFDFLILIDGYIRWPYHLSLNLFSFRDLNDLIRTPPSISSRVLKCPQLCQPLILLNRKLIAYRVPTRSYAVAQMNYAFLSFGVANAVKYTTHLFLT